MILQLCQSAKSHVIELLTMEANASNVSTPGTKSCKSELCQKIEKLNCKKYCDYFFYIGYNHVKVNV